MWWLICTPVVPRSGASQGGPSVDNPSVVKTVVWLMRLQMSRVGSSVWHAADDADDNDGGRREGVLTDAQVRMPPVGARR
jgi:hypothetical protein